MKTKTPAALLTLVISGLVLTGLTGFRPVSTIVTSSSRLIPLMLHGHKVKVKQDTSQVIERIRELGKKILAAHPGYRQSPVNNDSLINWNDQLMGELQSASLLSVDFIQRDYPGWKDAGLHVISASDQKLRIISWNDQLSGTNEEWMAVAFWLSDGKIKTAELSDKEYQGIRPAFRAITTVVLDNGKTDYLVMARGHEDNRLKYDYIKAYQIDSNGLLNDSPKPFKTASRHLNHIGFEIDLMSLKSLTLQERPYPLIHFSPDKKYLFIPVIDDEGALVPGAYLTYFFNGREFVFQSVKQHLNS